MAELDFQIRRATDQDIEVLVRLRMQFLVEITPNFNPESIEQVTAANREFFKTKLPSGTYAGWLAERENTVVGTAGLVMYDCPPTLTNPAGLEGYIHNIYTLPTLRCQGIATALMHELLDFGKRAGIPRFWLSATAPGRPIYERLGFRQMEDHMEWLNR